MKKGRERKEERKTTRDRAIAMDRETVRQYTARQTETYIQ
jgi:hypothetical protein